MDDNVRARDNCVMMSKRPQPKTTDHFRKFTLGSEAWGNKTKEITSRFRDE